MKKLLSFITATVLLFSLLSILPVNAETASGKCGQNLTWSLDGTALTITGTGEMYDYEEYMTPWWIYDITSAVIGEGVTSIGRYAFSSCYYLESITLPESLTKMAPSAIMYCEALKRLHIPSGVNDMGTGNPFVGCYALESITVDSGNETFHSAGNCLIRTATGKLITGCNNSVIPTDGSIKSIGEYAFYGCAWLTSVVIPENVENIGDSAFKNCTGLEKITLENGIKRIGLWSFKNCTGITDIIIPGSVETVETCAFEACTGLTEIVIEENVKYINPGAFSDCSGLEKVIVTSADVVIADDAFNIYSFAPEFVLYGIKKSTAESYAAGKSMVEFAEIKVGDVNCDGTIDTADATAILRYIINVGKVIDWAADCNDDGTIDTADATAILRYIINAYEFPEKK